MENNTVPATGKRIALITGASSGMGREFVLALDRQEKFDELWLVARRRERLEALQSQVRATVRAIPLDLGLPSSLERLKALLAEEKPDIRVLVNASGFGRFGAFTALPLDDQLKMIDLNAKALVSVTYLALPYMKPGSCVYELDSLSAFQPVPYINVYGATKAFVLSFSRALNVELKKQGARYPRDGGMPRLGAYRVFRARRSGRHHHVLQSILQSAGGHRARAPRYEEG